MVTDLKLASCIPLDHAIEDTYNNLVFAKPVMGQLPPRLLPTYSSVRHYKVPK